MAITINDVKTLQVRNAKNGDFDISLGDAPQEEPEEGVVQIQANVIQIRNAKNGDFDLILATGGGGYTLEEFATGEVPSGEIEINISPLRDYAFCKTNITSLVWNATGELRGERPFQNCTELLSVSLPNATSTRTNAFVNCTNLVDVHLPLVQSIDSGQFIENSKITKLVLPSMTGQIYNSSFRYNRLLKTADLGRVSRLNATIFLDCNVLDTLILRKSDAICTLSNVNTFNGTPFANGGAGGEIYVPSALINTYKTASQWSVLDGYGTVTWKAIEGSIYENAYADGTPIA